MGAAAELAQNEMDYDHKWMEFLSKRLMDKIFAALPHVIRNGDPVETYPGCINLSFAYVEGRYQIILIMHLFFELSHAK